MAALAAAGLGGLGGKEIMSDSMNTSNSMKRWLEIILSFPMFALGVFGIWLTLWSIYNYLAKDNVSPIIFVFVAAVFPIGTFCVLTAWRLFKGRSSRSDQKLISPILLVPWGLFFLFITVIFYFGLQLKVISLTTAIIAIFCLFLVFKPPKNAGKIN